jgi:hypothetical protein
MSAVFPSGQVTGAEAADGSTIGAKRQTPDGEVDVRNRDASAASRSAGSG